MDENLQWLVDQKEIQAVINAYASSVDNCNWDRLRSTFDSNIDRDYSSYTGHPREQIEANQHVSECRSILPGFDSTQHFLLNSEITINGDDASANVYLMADHTLKEENAQRQFTIRGIYTFGITRKDAGWKINAIALSVLSTHGEQNIFEIAGKRAAAMDESRLNAVR